MKWLLLIFVLCGMSSHAQNPLDDYFSNADDGENNILWPDGSRHVFTKVDGHIHGFALEYDPDGRLKSKAKLEHGKYIDTAYTFNKLGKILTIDFFREDTLLYSETREYYRDDSTLNVLSVYDLKNASFDISHQKHNEYTKTNFMVYGIISERRSRFRYLKGCEYTATYYFKNHQIEGTEHMLNGQVEGVQTWFTRDGKPSKTLNYRSGKLHGVQTYFDRKGNAETRCYSHGIKVTCRTP